MNWLFEAGFEEKPVTALVFPEMKVEVCEETPGETEERERGMQAATEARAMEERVAEARVRGREEGLAEGEKRRREAMEIERNAVTELCASFARERRRYFAEVEAEVVKLALAIAARVLQRESAMDPMLLKGVVQVALEKLGDAKGAVLRMSPEEAEVWRGVMTPAGVEVEGDALLERGELRLEAAGGVAELGVAAQLVEIERGFFDLLARRPA